MVGRKLYVAEFESETEVLEDSGSYFSDESDTKAIDSVKLLHLQDVEYTKKSGAINFQIGLLNAPGCVISEKCKQHSAATDCFYNAEIQNELVWQIHLLTIKLY